MTSSLRLMGLGRALVLLFALLLVPALHAQRGCGSMEYLEQQIAADPDRGLRLEQVEAYTNEFLQEGIPLEERAIVTIPVVFHIVYNTTTQNISDARILAQLQQLNDDFARLNSDAGNTPSLFQGVAANTQIQFCLAQRDPSGNPTTGIVRRQTTVTSFSSNDAVKYTANGGSNAWPRESYLNIWSCNLSSGLLGYAQFPGGNAATDGVVVLFSSVGSLNTPGTASNYNYGRTLTHEVGHWLNLRHIWGDATCGSDLVSDTPVHNTSNGGCPTYPHYSTCSGSPVEMTMNYMDYTYDACMNMFSAGQGSRMQALFGSGGSRVSLLSSLGCVPPSGGTTCATPAGLAAGSITSNSATLSWSAVSGALSYNLQYRQAGASTWTTVNTPATSYVLGSLASGTSHEAQGQAVCNEGSSAYSSAIAFLTLSASGCTDAWESNNSTGTAPTIPVNTDIQATIGSSTDVDWYKFNNTSSQRRIRIDLTNLPADYDVRLYRGTSSQVGISQNGGTLNEAIIYNTNKVGTYYVRVNGYNGAFNSAQCYTLRASISSTNFREGEGDLAEIGPVSGLMNVYPNPTVDQLMIDYIANTDGLVQVIVLDGLGRQVFTSSQSVVEGPSTWGVALPGLADGLYILQLVDGDDRHLHRFVVRH